VRNYREAFFRYYTDKKLFESFAYFTGHSFESLYSEDEMESMGNDGFRAKMNEQNVTNRMFPYLDTDDVPRYVSQLYIFSTALNGAMGRLTALLSLMVALLIGAIVAFLKYDVR
jgi:hypothetical protein